MMVSEYNYNDVLFTYSIFPYTTIIVIYIDFEETTYNFTERSFDVDYPCAVKLAKLNGTRSEQTIKVAIRADCLSSGCSAVSLSAGAVTIEPHQEIVNIPLRVLSDFVVENVEYINLSATLNEPAMSPRVRVGGGSPAVLAVTDDDSELQINAFLLG